MKKILFVIDSLGSGGAQNQVTLLACEMQKLGNEVTIYTYHSSDFFYQRIKEANVNFILNKKSTRIGINVIVDLYKKIYLNEFDYLISFLTIPSFYLCLSCIPFRGKNIIISYRSKTTFADLSLFQLLIRKFINFKSKWITSNSHHERVRWIKKYPTLKSKFSTIYNVVNVEQSFEKRKINRLKLNIISVGTLSDFKNVKHCIKIANYLKNEGVKFNYNWIGRKYFSKPNDLDYYHECNSLIEEYGLTDFWKWHDPTPDINKWLSCADCLLFMSKTEGLPNILCEAIAIGIPIIANNRLDNPILLNNGKNGFLVDEHDFKSIKEYLTDISGGINFYEDQMEFAKLHFNININTQKYLELN